MAIFPLDDVLSGGTRQLRTELVKGTVAVATLQNAVSATGNGTDFIVDGYGVATLQITGTFVATVTFYGSVDGTNFINIPAQNRNTGERALTTTTTGLYEIDCRGLQKIRASVTWTSGTSITIVGRAEPFAGSNSSMTLTGSSVAIPVDVQYANLTDGEALPIKRTEKIEEVFFYDNIAITATSNVISPVKDLSKYCALTFYVVNTHDQAIDIYPQLGNDITGYSTEYWDGTGFVSTSTNLLTIPVGATKRFVINKKWTEILDKPIKNLRFVAKATIAPSSGAITIGVWGVPN